MSAGLIVALELVSVLGVLVGFAGWDVYALRRDMKRKDE